MSAMAVCAVRGCEREATKIVQRRDPTLVEWAVCELHALELDVGPYATGANPRELIVGEGAPPRVLQILSEGRTSPYRLVTLVLGRDGNEEQRIEFFMTAEDAEALTGLFPKREAGGQS